MVRTVLSAIVLSFCAAGCKAEPEPEPARTARADAAAVVRPAVPDAAARLAAAADAAVPAKPAAARPSHPGGPGPAVALHGNTKAGALVYAARCKKCHGDSGKGGVKNDGSADGTVPGMNPIDPGIADKDAAVFATNLDLFIEHGSTPEGRAPDLSMPAFGDQKKLTPQQIADVIAYLRSLNP